MPPLTRALIIVNVLAYGLALLLPPPAVIALELWPLGSGLFEPWQPLSYAFLHGSLSHLGFNMLGLSMFGADLERLWGPRRFAQLYVVSVLTAAATQLALVSAVPTIGASGGVFGLLIAFGIAFPHRRVVPLIPPIPMPAWLFAALYALVELTMGVTGVQADVAHFAHLGGAVGGGLLARHWRGRMPPGSRLG